MTPDGVHQLPMTPDGVHQLPTTPDGVHQYGRVAEGDILYVAGVRANEPLAGEPMKGSPVSRAERETDNSRYISII